MKRVKIVRKITLGFFIVHAVQILADHAERIALSHDAAVVHPCSGIAHPLDDAHSVRHENDRDTLRFERTQVIEATALELLVAYGNNLIDKKNLWIDMNCNCKSESDEHPA